MKHLLAATACILVLAATACAQTTTNAALRQDSVVVTNEQDLVALERQGTLNEATKELTGFSDPSAITVTYNNMGFGGPNYQTITLAQEGGISLWWRGTNIILPSPWTSTSHPTTQGTHYLAFRDSTNAVWSTDPWTFDMAQIAVVIVGASDELTFAIKETHGLMPWQSHENAHRTIGSYRLSGFAPVAGSYVLQSDIDTNMTPAFAAGVIKDEDNATTVAAIPKGGSYTCVTFTGATHVAKWGKFSSSPFSNITGTYPNINVNGTSNTVSSSGKFLNVWQVCMPATAGEVSDDFGMIFIQPQREHSSIESARAEDFRSLQIGGLTAIAPEWVAFTKITYRTAANYTSTSRIRIEEISYLTGSQASQTTITSLTTPSTASAISVAATPTGYSAAAANVEEHLKGVDAKLGSFNVMTNQTWGALGTNATYRMSWDVTNMTFKVEEILP